MSMRWRTYLAACVILIAVVIGAGGCATEAKPGATGNSPEASQGADASATVDGGGGTGGTDAESGDGAASEGEGAVEGEGITEGEGEGATEGEGALEGEGEDGGSLPDANGEDAGQVNDLSYPGGTAFFTPQPGEAIELPVQDKTEQYLVALYSVDPKKAKELSYTISGEGIWTGPAGGRNLARQTPPRPAYRHPEHCFQPPLASVLEFRRAHPEAFRPRRTKALAAPLPQTGDILTFKVNRSTNIVEVEAEVVAVSNTLVITVDQTTLNPEGAMDFESQDLQDLISYFETIILPRERFYFHQESDVNNDGHITLLFTPLVEELGAMAYVNPYDLLLEDQPIPAYVASNHQELIYLTPPNMLGGPMGSIKSVAETMAHEFNHAIYFYAKFMLNEQLDVSENVYVTEGFSALAQDLSGFQIGNLFTVWQGLSDLDDFSINDMTQWIPSYITDRDTAFRAFSYLLLRYLFDRAGGDKMDQNGEPQAGPGVDWLHRMFVAPEIGEVNIPLQASLTMEQIMEDWFLAMLLDDRGIDGSETPISRDPRYGYLPVTEDPLTGRHRGFSMFMDIISSIGLDGPPIHQLNEARGSLRAGGVEYFEISVDPDAATARFTVDSAGLESFRVAVVRSR